MSKHRKAQGHKPPGDKKQKSNGKKEVKDKIVAAELGAAVLREEAPKPAPVPVARPRASGPGEGGRQGEGARASAPRGEEGRTPRSPIDTRAVSAAGGP